MNKLFGKAFAMVRLEHRSFEHIGATECYFAMAGAGYRFNTWLSGDFSYEFWKIPSANNIGFNGIGWIRSLHYFGTEISVSNHSTFDLFYMYHLFHKADNACACNILGIGYILTL